MTYKLGDRVVVRYDTVFTHLLAGKTGTVLSAVAEDPDKLYVEMDEIPGWTENPIPLLTSEVDPI